MSARFGYVAELSCKRSVEGDWVVGLEAALFRGRQGVLGPECQQSVGAVVAIGMSHVHRSVGTLGALALRGAKR